MEWLEPRWLLSAGSTDADSGGLVAGITRPDFRVFLPPPYFASFDPAALRVLLPDAPQGDASTPVAPATRPTPPLPLLSTAKTVLGFGLSSVEVEALPATDDLLVTGTLYPDRSDRTFRIPIGPTTVSLSIELRSDVPGTPLAETMSLMDESWREIARSMPEPGSAKIWLHVPQGPLDELRARGGVLFLRLEAMPGAFGPVAPTDTTDTPDTSAPAAESGVAAPALGFVLTVTRHDSETPPSGASAAYPEPVVLTTGRPTDSPPPPPARTGHADTAGIQLALDTTRPPTARAAPRSNGEVATGPLPTLSAGPIGGILSNGDEETVSDRRDPATVDLHLLEVPPALSDTVDVMSPDGTAAGPDPGEAGAEAVVSVRGPGGVPLLGSALQTETRARRVTDPVEFPDDAPARAVALAAAAVPPSEFPNDSPETRPRRGLRRLPWVTGLALAFATVTRAVLPDLADRLPQPSRFRRR